MKNKIETLPHGEIMGIGIARSGMVFVEYFDVGSQRPGQIEKIFLPVEVINGLRKISEISLKAS